MLFPAMFYLLFGVLMAKANGAEAARYLLASYGVFGVMSPGLFGFGVSLALERDGGLLTFKRALPMPPGAYLLGKMLMAMAAAGVVLVLLMTMELSLGHVTLNPFQAIALLLTGIPGVLPFCALTSEERRVGEECVCPCRSWCLTVHYKKNKANIK